MKILAVYILLLLSREIASQNLVPNSSFENLINCTSAVIENAQPWCGINTAGVLNSCIAHTYYSVPTQYFTLGYPSYQMPRNGSGYASFPQLYTITSAQPRYAHVPLIDTLTAGKARYLLQHLLTAL